MGGPYTFTDVVKIRSPGASVGGPDENIEMVFSVTGDVDRDGTPDTDVIPGSWQRSW